MRQIGDRQYGVYKPDSYKPGNPAIFALHGKGGNAEDFLGLTRLWEGASRFGFMIILPEADEQDSYLWHARTDEQYLLSVFVDAQTTDVFGLVFGAGFSMGGGIIQWFAERNPELFFALTVVCAGCPWTNLPLDPLESSIPVDILMHYDDPVVPFTTQGAEVWAAKNNVSSTPKFIPDWRDGVDLRSYGDGIVRHYGIKNKPEAPSLHTWFREALFGVGVNYRMAIRAWSLLRG
jgi:poly(3-hydroxybutyrate) depolymerase